MRPSGQPDARTASSRGPAWALPAVMSAAFAWAWMNRFICDDAFISFRYARNLVLGNGLLWNPGERVEGYTNFLWTVLLAGGMRLGIGPISASYGLGLACYAALLAVTYRLARLLLARRSDAVLVVLLLGTNYTVSSFATSGLETSMQTLIAVSFALIVLEGLREDRFAPGRMAALSVTAALGVMTRMDTALLLAAPGAAAVFHAMFRGEKNGKALRLAALVFPCASLITAWLAWRYHYYGDLVPNTYYAKVDRLYLWALKQGALYAASFFTEYWLGWMPFVLAAALPDIARKSREFLVLPAAVLVWTLYLMRIGGDFMEFRMLVPAAPFIYVCCVWAVNWMCASPAAKACIVLALIAASLLHSVTFASRPGIASMRGLDDQRDLRTRGGEVLKESLKGSGVILAARGAGAVPYHSELDFVDIHGLNDRWVARNGIYGSRMPGHQKYAPLEYLIERKVAIILGGWRVVEGAALKKEYHPHDLDWLLPGDGYYTRKVEIYDLEKLPESASVLAVPLGDDKWLLTLYLTQSPAVERMVAGGGWKSFPITGDKR